jgi:type IX secretion system PorP/SprF family membrane protein
MRYLFRLLLKGGCWLWLACPALLLSHPGSAQSLQPFGAAYFQDQYLLNPAMAGTEAGTWDLYAGYRRQWLSVPDGPANQFATGAYGLNSHVGLGLNLYNDQAGLMRTTRVMGTYAYHVQLDGEKQRLLFGLSAGILSRRADNSAIVGDPSDAEITKFNERSTRFDADFGAAYTDGKLTVQAALPAMVSDLRKGQQDEVARTVLFTAVAWRFTLNQEAHGLALTPKLCYRATKGYDNMVDAGADLSVYDGLLDVFGLYHSTGNATFGVGVNVKKTLAITAVYLTPSSSVSSYSHGSFGVSLGLRIGAGAPKTHPK